MASILDWLIPSQVRQDIESKIGQPDFSKGMDSPDFQRWLNTASIEEIKTAAEDWELSTTQQRRELTPYEGPEYSWQPGYVAPEDREGEYGPWQSYSTQTQDINSLISQLESEGVDVNSEAGRQALWGKLTGQHMGYQRTGMSTSGDTTRRTQYTGTGVDPFTEGAGQFQPTLSLDTMDVFDPGSILEHIEGLREPYIGGDFGDKPPLTEESIRALTPDQLRGLHTGYYSGEIASARNPLEQSYESARAKGQALGGGFSGYGEREEKADISQGSFIKGVEDIYADVDAQRARNLEDVYGVTDEWQEFADYYTG